MVKPKILLSKLQPVGCHTSCAKRRSTTKCFVWSECEKRKHKKRKTDYWETENSKTKVSDDRHEVAGTSTCSTRTKIDLSKLKAKELRKEINALGLKPKGLSKMNETQLLPLLQLQNERHFASVLFPFNLNSPEILLPFNNRNWQQGK